MGMSVLSYANVLGIYPRLCFQVGSASWLRTYLTNQYVILRYYFPNLCKCNYLYGNLSFYKIQVNRFMAWDDSSGAKIIPKYILWMRGLVPFWVLRHSFLSLTDCWWLYNIQLKSSRGVLFLPPSDAYVRRFLYLLYTLIKLYYTKALSDQALSLAPDWILLLQRPRTPGSFRGSATAFHYDFSAVVWKPVAFLQGLSWWSLQRSLVDYSPWGHKELNMTEQLTLHFHFFFF